MNCDDVQKFVHAFVDGEFDEADERSFREHLGKCEYCREVVEFEQAFRRRLSDSLEAPAAPAGLRARVLGVLDEIDDEPVARDGHQRERDSRVGLLSAPWVRRAVVPALGVAAAALLALGIMRGRWFGQGLRDARARGIASIARMGESGIRWHRRRVPLDVRASSLGPIRRFFRNKVDFKVRAPRFRSGVRARLIGARLTNLGAHDAVCLVYDVGGRRLSVFVVDQRALAPASRGSSKRVFWHHAHGYRAALYKRHGMGYAVTSDMNRRNLVRLISASE